MLNLREDGHRIATVLYQCAQVMIVEFGIIWEECRQHHFDTERTTHRREIIAALTERYEQVHNMALDIHQMLT